MGNYVKALAAFVLLMAAIVFVPMKADAATLTKPTGLKQTKADQGGVEFTWDAVEGADGYIIDGSVDGTTYNTFPKAALTPSYTVTGLDSGVSLYVKVMAVKLGETEKDDVYSEYSDPFETVTAPNAASITVNCSERTQTSLTFTWTAAARGATSYVVYDYSNKQVLATLPAGTMTYKRDGLVAGSAYGIAVEAVRTSASGYAAASTYVSTLYNVYTNKGAPVTPSTSDFFVSIPNVTAKSASFLALDPNRQADGYEVEVYKVKGGKKVKTLSANNGVRTNSMAISKNTPYKYRVRYYVDNNGQKTYGGWSGYRYFFNQSVSGKTRGSVGSRNVKIIQKWGKVEGATGYKVYISTKKDSGYKLVKSVGKNVKSVTITKIGKKKLVRGVTYYIKVVPTVKDGKKTIKNDTPIINY